MPFMYKFYLNTEKKTTSYVYCWEVIVSFLRDCSASLAMTPFSFRIITLSSVARNDTLFQWKKKKKRIGYFLKKLPVPFFKRE